MTPARVVWMGSAVAMIACSQQQPPAGPAISCTQFDNAVVYSVHADSGPIFADSCGGGEVVSQGFMRDRDGAGGGG